MVQLLSLRRTDMILRLFKLFCLFIAFFCPYLIASTTPSMKSELDAFLQLYNSSLEKSEGWSSIAYAIENDYDSIVEFFINKGEDFNTYYEIKFSIDGLKENIYRKHPFLTAIAQGKIFLVSLMATRDSSLSYYPKNKMYVDDPEEFFAKYFDSSTTREIVQKRRALQIAITDCPCPYEMVQILLNGGAWVKQKDSFRIDPKTNYLRFTPLTHAILEKRLDIATLLIDHGAPIDYDIHGFDNQSLLQAVRIGFIEGTIFLLKHGAIVDKEILWDAIYKNELNIVKLLLDINDKVDFEMIIYANANGFHELADTLINAYIK